MFRTSSSLLAALWVVTHPDETAPIRRGPLVTLPSYSDGVMLWSPVYWFAILGLVVCWRTCYTCPGVRIFRSVDAAVEWGRTV